MFARTAVRCGKEMGCTDSRRKRPSWPQATVSFGNDSYSITFLLPQVLFLSSLPILSSSFLPCSVSLRLQRLFFGRETKDKKLAKRTLSPAERRNGPVDASRPPQANAILRITDTN